MRRPAGVLFAKRLGKGCPNILDEAPFELGSGRVVQFESYMEAIRYFAGEGTNLDYVRSLLHDGGESYCINVNDRDTVRPLRQQHESF